jgi:4-amino-4-deoxy-L-arabinose transferase-like glycosyltransferase
MDRSGTRIAAALLFATLAIRVAFVLATPNYQLIHDALDYDNHAASIAQGHGFALSYGRPTAFRPPAYPIFLAGIYKLVGTENKADRVRAARLANAVVGTAIVALIGLLAFQFWGRREALVALALGAVYIPLILVGQSVMSEPLFVLCLLGAIACALRRWALAAGVLAGLAILGRANALVVLAPLAWAVWGPAQKYRYARCGASAAPRATRDAHVAEPRSAIACGPRHPRLHHVRRTARSSADS